jgi:hypothetical protein
MADAALDATSTCQRLRFITHGVNLPDMYDFT